MTASTPSGFAGATNGHRQPADLEPTRVTLDDVRALYERGTGVADDAYAERVERYDVATTDANLESTATIANGGFRIITNIDGADVQGDDLDRWPVVAIGFLLTQCDLVGEIRGSARAFVLACVPDGEIPHWFYVDAQSGLVRREVTRDGSRVVTYAFDDFRTERGIERPIHRSTVAHS